MRDDRAYLRHIEEAIERIATYTIGGHEAFLREPMVRDAVLRNLEIIGEATKNLTPEIRSRRPDVPWQRIASLRDILIHRYFGVDFTLVWQVVEHRLPQLALDVRSLLAEIDR